MLGPVELVDEVDSTNRVMLDRAREGAPHGLVLVAGHQTAGRGRLDRRWEAEPGAALLVSVLLRPALDAARLHLLTMAAALAAAEACADLGAADVRLKWPNDLVVERDGHTRKLAGLLAESIIEGDRVATVVVGLGLNLRTGGLPDGAIALDEMAPAVERDLVLAGWLRRFDALLDDLDVDALLTAYRTSCVTLGHAVHVDLPNGAIDGIAYDVADDGRLVIDVGGDRVSVAVGDVTHVRHVSPG